MAISQANIDALNAAIAKGERVVRMGDRSVEYRSVAELISARNNLESRKAAEDAAAAGKTVPRQTLMYHGGRGMG